MVKLTTHRRYKLREARRILGLTQRELATLAGVSVAIICRIESDRIGYGHRLEGAQRISEALGLTIDEILWPNALTQHGRQIGTGKPIGSHHLAVAKSAEICEICFIEKSVTGVCSSNRCQDTVLAA